MSGAGASGVAGERAGAEGRRVKGLESLVVGEGK